MGSNMRSPGSRHPCSPRTPVMDAGSMPRAAVDSSKWHSRGFAGGPHLVKLRLLRGSAVSL